VISQFRTMTFGSRALRVIQTQTAINPGNSGGGLYDGESYLVGINTWTSDKRFSEGLSFAIAFDSLLALDPPGLHPGDHLSPGGVKGP
jgi:S1-C subfamily serine protease